MNTNINTFEKFLLQFISFEKVEKLRGYKNLIVVLKL